MIQSRHIILILLSIFIDKYIIDCDLVRCIDYIISITETLKLLVRYNLCRKGFSNHQDTKYFRSHIDFHIYFIDRQSPVYK